MTMRWTTWVTWIPAVAAMALAVAWAMTGSYPLAMGAVICIAVTLGALWWGAEPADDSTAPHPLDPQQEANRRARMALGQMRRRYRHTRDEERGL
jgi:hypothetical protein